MTSKPRILLVPDRPGWAFDFLADELMQFAGERYDFTKVAMADLDPKADYSVYDAIYFFWWGQGSREFARAARIPRRKTMSVVSSFNSWVKMGWGPEQLGQALRAWSAVGVTSPELRTALDGRHPRIFVTRHGIDPTRFVEREPIPARRVNDELVVGWAGSLKYAELKGVPGVLEPAVTNVPGARLHLAIGDGEHPAGRAYPRERMVDFYTAIDVYVCASSTEGAPLTLLESGACGRPVITTPVGIAPELVRDGVSGFLVERSAEAVAAALRELRDDRERLIAMGQRLKRDVLDSWTWTTRIREYETMFDAVVTRGRPLLRRMIGERWFGRSR